MSSSFFFKLIAFNDINDYGFEYNFNNSRWLETNKNNLTINAIPYGQSTLKIRSKLYPETILYIKEFNVPVPIAKRVWFIALIVIFSVLLMSFIVYVSIRLNSRRKEAKLKKVSTELKLLISQMNPHFTFNSIHSIQYYILNNNKDKAIEYLSDFALLIRKTLDFSMNEFITLNEEMEFLKLYVSLENKRLEFDYDIRFNWSDDRLLDKKIPALLLQPLIENVIVHASYDNHEDQKMEVDFVMERDFFVIRVIDYGNGDTKGDLKSHKSYGLTILRNRIKIYNGKHYDDGDLMVVPTNQETNKGHTVVLKIKIWM